MGILASRQDQMFPVLTPAQVEVARRFASGDERDFDPGSLVYGVGEIGAPSWLVTAGTMDISRRRGLGGEAFVTTYGAGQFSGEVNSLSGRPSIAAGRAGLDGCRALPFDAAHLRAMMVGSADIGETVMRALILRRAELLEDAEAGTILVGDPNSPDLVRLQGFLARTAYPNLVMDSATDPEGRDLILRMGVAPDELPLVVCPNGTFLRRPTEHELALCLGMMPDIDDGTSFDVAVVGAGPAGLAAAVYAASEGLSVLVLDQRAAGGQAGASARIENYLGFPTGITGHALTARAYNQATKFGAQIAVPLRVDRLDCRGPELALDLSDGKRITARSVVIASGASYRRPAIPDLAAFEGNGVSYWASPIEAKICAGEEVAVVGGGNSAGQAIVFLAPHVKRLHLFVRRPLLDTMSRYLVDRIAALPNVDIHLGYEIVALTAASCGGLQSATARRLDDGATSSTDLRHVFLFIGADPNTGWLDGCVAIDDKGFILTGGGALPLETDRPGVFAIGDVRAGSTKRVASAVGEGAAVVSQIHAKLALQAAGMSR